MTMPGCAGFTIILPHTAILFQIGIEQNYKRELAEIEQSKRLTLLQN